MSATKFTQARRAAILEMIRAGGSRAQAAKAAKVHPSQISRWLAKGAVMSPEGRWGTFRRELLEAEGRPPELIELHAIDEREHTMPDMAWKFLVASGEFDDDPDRPSEP